MKVYSNGIWVFKIVVMFINCVIDIIDIIIYFVMYVVVKVWIND